MTVKVSLQKKKKNFRTFNKFFKWKSSTLAFKLKNIFSFKLRSRRRRRKLFRRNYFFRRQYLRDRNLLCLLKKKYKPKKKAYYKLFKNKISNALLLKKKYLKKVNIKITQNNIFCTFIDLKKRKTLHIASSGLYKIKLSKKTLKRFYRPVINLFLYNIRKYCRNFNSTIFNVIAPLKFRRNIGKLIKINIVTSAKKLRGQLKFNKKRSLNNKSLKTLDVSNKKPSEINNPQKFSKAVHKLKRNRYNILVQFISKKCFNGCRVKKAVRKKRRFYRIYK